MRTDLSLRSDFSDEARVSIGNKQHLSSPKEKKHGTTMEIMVTTTLATKILRGFGVEGRDSGHIELEGHKSIWVAAEMHGSDQVGSAILGSATKFHGSSRIGEENYQIGRFEASSS